MRKEKQILARKSTAAAAAALGMVLLLAGCGLSTSTSTGGGTSVPPTIVAGMHGMVHGGRQPIAGATLYLYAASTAGYAAANTNRLPAGVTTANDGSFTITSMYSCAAGEQMYMVAMGGDPGAGPNDNIAIMAALGDCSKLTSSTFIDMNEVTTVGSVFALAPFMNSVTELGTSPTNIAGLARAFVSVNKLVDIGKGTVGGPALAPGATVPEMTINTLADALATCVNSTGGAAGTDTPCGKLFDFATPNGGAAPNDTVAAALAIAKNPGLNTRGLNALATPQAPFQPRLTGTPNDWTLAIHYTAGNFNAPKSTSIDANGNVWVANSGNNTLTVLAQTGVPTSVSPLAGNGLNTPGAIAIDANGNAWVANQSGTTVSAFTNSGGVMPGSPFSGAGNIKAPSALAIDPPGNIWIANYGGDSVTELDNSGTYVRQVLSGVSAPVGIVINSK